MPFQILILSDSHLFGSREQELFGVNTHDALERLSAHIRTLNQSIDLVVASGDLSEDGQPAAYEDFHSLTQGLGTSMVWMKGNHDQFDNVPDDLASKYIHQETHLDSWSLIFLDTAVKGKDEGLLGARELSRLEGFLERNRNKYVLIFMHHPPLAIGSDFIDELALQNKQVFWDLVTGFDNIKGIICGHVHQAFDLEFNGIRILSTPSTAVQFKPFSKKLTFDAPTLGWSTLTLDEEGSFDKEIGRIAAPE